MVVLPQRGGDVRAVAGAGGAQIGRSGEDGVGRAGRVSRAVPVAVDGVGGERGGQELHRASGAGVRDPVGVAAVVGFFSGLQI